MSALTLLETLSITGKHREDWYRALAKTCREGLPLHSVLVAMEQEFAKTKHPLTPLLKVLLFRMRYGDSANGRSQDGRRTIGTELRDLVPASEAMLIQAGALAGDMPAGLINAADYLVIQGRIKDALVGAMAKPLGYFAALNALLIYLATDLLPTFAETRPRENWPTEAKALGFVADNVVWISGGAITAVVGLIVFIAFVAPRWVGRRREWVDRHIWPFTVLAALNGANMLTSLAGYISAGTSFDNAIKNIRASATPYMQMQCDRITSLTHNGARPQQTLTQLSIVMPRYHWLIAVYGLAGESPETYKTIATEMVERTLKFITHLFGTVISNVMLGVVAAAVMWIYASMFAIADPTAQKVTVGSALLQGENAFVLRGHPTNPMNLGDADSESGMAALNSIPVC